MRRTWSGLGVLLLAVIGGGLVVLAPTSPRTASVPDRAAGEPAPSRVNFTGAQVCAGCHVKEYTAWKGSDHALAMQHANRRTVLGDFGNVKFTYAGVTTAFSERDGKFFVNTEGPDGKLHDYEVAYTFGVRPLQQYLIEFPDGRLQALSIAWDTRSKEQGGQRWFHLYPEEDITYEDELHWTRPAQNWNFMCADCHSTALRKNYDAGKDRFETRWAAINVSCEACHGPGVRHVAWARAVAAGKPAAEDGNKGLSVRFDEHRSTAWALDEASGNAVRSAPRASEQEIQVCAQCHARRGQIADGYEAGDAFLDHYRPALLTQPLYYPDGQQRGEVYEWGSFLQSKMYARGVTCSDCHEPHSGKLYAEANAVCARCHAPGKYETGSHHHHPTGTSGARCVSCHMPARTYMVIDPRRDHSFRVPRPDLSIPLGTPNACNGCHSERDARWAAQHVMQWYGHEPRGYQRFARALAAPDGTIDANARLRALAEDSTQPPIARATALESVTVAPRTLIAGALRDPNPLVRFGALGSIARAPADQRAALAAPLLSDPVRMVRLEAAAVLADVPPEQLNTEARAPFQRAAGEYVASQRYNADRADARANLGTFYAKRNDTRRAETELKEAIRLDPFFVPAYVNLADLYRVLGRDSEGETTLRKGLEAVPDNAPLHHAMGLVLVRLKRIDDAVAELGKAAALEPRDARFVYVHAVALHSTGKVKEAIAALERALHAHPEDRDILAALVAFNQRVDSARAARYAERLRALNESMTQAQ